MRNQHLQYNSISINHHPAEELHESFHINVGEEGELFLTVGFTNIVDEVQCKNTLYTVVQTLQGALFSESNTPLYERFEDGVKQLNHYLSDKNFIEIGRLHVAAGLLEGTVMYITKTGGGEIYLLRGKVCTNVTANFNDYPTTDEETNSLSSITEGVEGYEYFTNIATGDLENKDILLLSSVRFTKYIGEQEVLALFGKSNMEIGFINMEHKLKENPHADITVMGFIYSDGEVQTTHIVGNQSDYEEDSQMYVPQARKEAIDLKEIFKKLFKGEYSLLHIRGFFTEFIEQQKLYLTNPKYRTKIITLGIVLLLIILLINVSAAINGKQSAEEIAQLQQKFTEAQKEYQLGVTNNIKGDRQTARTHLENAKKLTLDLKDQKKSTADMNTLLDKIEKAEDEANKLTRVSDESIFIDLNSSIGSEAVKGLAYFDEKVYVYSSTNIYGPFVNNTTNANSKYPVEDNNLIKDVAYFDDLRGLIIKLAPDKVAEFINNDFKYTDTTSTTWKPGDNIATFGSNLYFLSENQIWRYTRNKSVYRGPSPWLQKADPVLKDAVSFDIDGSIYALLKTGTLRKYFQGKPVENFSIQDLPEGILDGADDRSKVSTRTTWSHIYLLNHATGKIVVLNKIKGNTTQVSFERQYGFDHTEIIHMAISADEKTLLALGNNKKIYKIDL